MNDQPERYSRLPFERCPAGQGLEFVYAPGEPKTRLLPRHQADVLFEVQGFQTLEQHAQAYAGRISGWRKLLKPLARTALQGTLSQLAQDGLLISLSGLLKQCRSLPVETPPRISTVGIVTCDRTALLERALQSYMRNARDFGRQVHFVVMDDSAQAQVRERHRELLRDIARIQSVPVFYAGWEEKQNFAKALTAQGLPPEVVAFALFGIPGCSTYGANRNALLLQTPGELFFSADDDTICRVAASPGIQAGLSIGRETAPQEIWFYADSETAERSVLFEAQDLLALHERFLGKDPLRCLGEVGDTEGLNVDRLDPGTLSDLIQRKNRIFMTGSGLIGDCARSYPLSYLYLQGESRRRLLASPEAYRLLETRQVIVADRRTALGLLSRSFLFHAAGFDHRDVLPPFFPVLSGQDTLFLEISRRLCEGAWMARAPWLVCHEPNRRPPFSPDLFGTVPIRLIDCMLAILEMMPGPGPRSVCPHPGVEATMKTLGDYFISLSRLSERAFMDFVQTGLQRMRIQMIVRAESALQASCGAPDFWAKDVRRHLQAARQLFQAPARPIPSNLVPGNDEEAAAAFHKLMFEFGRLLTYWPAIRESAENLRKQGLRPAVML